MPASHCSVSPEAGDAEIDADEASGGEVVGIGAPPGHRSSFSYHRLPEPFLRLTVCKLDGSSFDVHIARAAAVWELKSAIEDVFTVQYDDTGKSISWQHVWGHFCLCFKHQRLTDDKATLRAFGIRDGDELHFVQHLSVDYPCQKLSKNHKAASHRRSMTSVDEFNEGEGDKKLTETRRSTSLLEEELGAFDCNEECMEQEYRKKGSFFRGLFSYSRLRSSRTHSEDVVQCAKSEKKGTRSKLGKWLSSKKTKAQSK